MNLASADQPEERHLFIVRVWREASQAAPGDQWRGSVEHAPSGQRIHFASLDALTRFMRQFMNSVEESEGMPSDE
jgi:hypothetical protein